MGPVKQIREQLRKRTKLQRFAIMAALLEEDGFVAEGQGEMAVRWFSETGTKLMTIWIKGQEIFGAVKGLGADAVGNLDDLFGADADPK